MKTRSKTTCCCSELLCAFSDKNRLSIILFLAGGEKCVCEIFRHLKLPQNLVSHHLGILRQSKLIKSRKDGRWVYYSLNRESIKKLQKFLEKLLQKNNK